MREILLLLALSVNIVKAQTEVLDSLKREIDSYEEPVDSNYVKLRLGFIDRNIFSGIGDSAILSYIKETQSIAEKVNYPTGVVKSIQRVGVIYQYFLGQPFDAINQYQLALDLIMDDASLKQHKFTSYNNLANIYINLKDFEKALQLNRTLIKMGLPKYGKTLHDIGNIYGELEKWDSAIYYYAMAVDTLEKVVEPSSYSIEHSELTSSYLNLCNAYIKLSKADSAFSYLNQSMELIERYDLGYSRTRAYINASELYYLDGNLKESEKFAMLALKNDLNKILSHQIGIHDVLQKIYYQQGRYKEALKAYKQASMLQDSISSMDRRLEVSTKVMEYEAKQKEASAAQAILRQKIITRTYVIVGVSLLLILCLVFIFFYQRRKALAKAKESEFQKDLAESRLVALRTQLNPHFIFNALNSIDEYMINEGVEKASSYLVKFSSLMRMILENSNKDWVSLEEEMELMRLYVAIEGLRLDNQLDFRIDIDTQIDSENSLVPSFFIQPFIENSIEHGIAKKKEDGTISVQIIKESNNKIVCIIKDDGIGILEKSEKTKSTSMGIKIAQSRIDYISQLIGDESSFEIDNLDPGVKVTLSIPFKLKF